jgi:group I intron endonuclease
VGSSTDLGRRLRGYYNINYLERVLKKGNSIIISALLKEGYANFSLDILCYCDPASTIQREQDYIDLIKPEYNILQKAGSSHGFNHSEETKQKMRDRVRRGEEKTRLLEMLKELNSSEKHREHLKRLNSSIEQKKHLERLHKSLKGRAKPEGSGLQKVALEVFDKETGIKTTYPSMGGAALAMGVSTASISKAFKHLQETVSTEGGVPHTI